MKRSFCRNFIKLVAFFAMVSAFAGCSDGSMSADDLGKFGPYLVSDEMDYEVNNRAFIFTHAVCKEEDGKLTWSRKGAKSQLQYVYRALTGILTVHMNGDEQTYGFFGNEFPVGTFKGDDNARPSGFIVGKNSFKMVEFYDSKCMAQSLIDMGWYALSDDETVVCNEIVRSNGRVTSFEPNGDNAIKIIATLGNVTCKAADVQILRSYVKADCEKAYRIHKEKKISGTFKFERSAAYSLENEECMADLVKEAELLENQRD